MANIRSVADPARFMAGAGGVGRDAGAAYTPVQPEGEFRRGTNGVTD